jgi:hypothetical protein
MELFIGQVPIGKPRAACCSFNIRNILFVCVCNKIIDSLLPNFGPEVGPF